MEAPNHPTIPPRSAAAAAANLRARVNAPVPLGFPVTSSEAAAYQSAMAYYSAASAMTMRPASYM